MSETATKADIAKTDRWLSWWGLLLFIALAFGIHYEASRVIRELKQPCTTEQR